MGHEHTHVFAQTVGFESAEQEERAAYFMGACAQVVATGGLKQEGLPGGLLQDDGSLPEAVLNSSRIALEVRNALFDRLGADRGMVLDSTAGRELLEICNEQAFLLRDG